MGVPYAEVIGDPIAHSKSPLIHKFWLEKLGIEGDYRATRVTDGNLHQYLAARRRDADWRGCSVAAPLKQSIMPYVARLDPGAEKAGAANLVVPASGGRSGFNTDVKAVGGLLPPCRRQAYPNQVATYVQIIGAGGAARAAVIGAIQAGYIDFDFFDRTVDKAMAMATWLSLDPKAYSRPLEALGPIRNPEDGPGDQRYSHVIVNATPMGMEGVGDVRLDLELYYPDTIVFDMAYGRCETGLVRRARALGLRTIDGMQMLIEQAAEAFAVLFAAAAPREHDKDLHERLKS